MTPFWLAAGLLTLLVLAALAWSLTRRAAPPEDDGDISNLLVLRAQRSELDAERAAGNLSDEQHALALAELERRVLDEVPADSRVRSRAEPRSGRLSAAVLAIGVPLVAGLLYLRLGNPEALDPAAVQAASHGGAGMGDMASAADRLAEKLAAQPDNADGWVLLARTTMQLGRFEVSRDAYAKAVALGAADAQLYADYADAAGMAQGRRLAGEPEALIQKALAIDPNHLKALALAGSAAMERGDPAAAIAHWTKARNLAPADSGWAGGLDAGIAEARAAAGQPAGAAGAKTPADGVAAAPAAASLRVSVTLAPALAAQVQAGDILFVFARAAEGPRMPLAIVRQPLGVSPSWPLALELSDAMAMSPQMMLSAFPRVVVAARITRGGGATPQSGDLEGESAAVASSDAAASVIIDRVRP